MAGPTLSNAEGTESRFRRYILSNLSHWQTFVNANNGDIRALDQDWQNIIRAISFALSARVEDAAVFSLIRAFAPHMERRGHWDAWHKTLQQASELAEYNGDEASLVAVLILKARLLQRQSHPTEAIQTYQRIIKLARQSSNQFEEARACSNLGFLFIDRGHWYRSEVFCCHALQLFAVLRSDHGQAHTRNHLGLLYTRQGKWAQAEAQLKQACNLWQAMEDDHSLIYGLINQALLCLANETPQDALPHLSKALQLAERTGEAAYTGSIWLNLAIAHRRLDNLDQAEASAQQARKIYQHHAERLGCARTLEVLGVIYHHQGKWQKAIQYLEVALSRFRELHHHDDEIQTLLDLVKCYLAMKDWPRAEDCLNVLENTVSGYNWDQQRANIRAEIVLCRRRLLDAQTS